MDNPKSTKIALLLNALVMPGSGHIFIGQKLKGYLLSLVTLALLIIPIVRYTMTVVNSLNALVVSGNISASALSTMGKAWTINKNLILFCLAGTLAAWIYGIIDIIIIRSRHGLSNRQK